MIEARKITLVPDYHQFYIHDSETGIDPNDDGWTRSEMADRIHVALCHVSVTTMSEEQVEVEILVQDDPPGDDDFAAWDHVAEGSIDVPSGTLVVAGCTEDFETAARVDVGVGRYRARVYCGGFDTVDEYGYSGKDHYRILLYRAAPAPPRVLKRFDDPTFAPPPEPTGTPIDLPPGFAEWIDARIAEMTSNDAPTTLLRTMAAALRVLPLSYDDREDRGACVGITPQGHLIQFFLRDDPRYVTTIEDRNTRAAFLAIGSRRFPELSVIVPARPPDALECPLCKGTGVFPQATFGIPCTCGGLGWTYPRSMP